MIVLLYSQPSLFIRAIWKRAQGKLFDGKKKPRKSSSIPIYNHVPWGVYMYFRLGFPLNVLAMSSTVIKGFSE